MRSGLQLGSYPLFWYQDETWQRTSFENLAMWRLKKIQIVTITGKAGLLNTNEEEDKNLVATLGSMDYSIR